MPKRQVAPTKNAVRTALRVKRKLLGQTGVPTPVVKFAQANELVEGVVGKLRGLDKS